MCYLINTLVSAATESQNVSSLRANGTRPAAFLKTGRDHDSQLAAKLTFAADQLSALSLLLSNLAMNTLDGFVWRSAGRRRASRELNKSDRLDAAQNKRGLRCDHRRGAQFREQLYAETSRLGANL